MNTEPMYPVMIHWIQEGADTGYFLAYLPDFGYSTCSASGDTIEEALGLLEFVKQETIRYFIKSGKDIPKVSKGPREKG